VRTLSAPGNFVNLGLVENGIYARSLTRIVQIRKIMISLLGSCISSIPIFNCSKQSNSKKLNSQRSACVSKSYWQVYILQYCLNFSTAVETLPIICDWGQPNRWLQAPCSCSPSKMFRTTVRNDCRVPLARSACSICPVDYRRHMLAN
jgi:hypothetical protein